MGCASRRREGRWPGCAGEQTASEEVLRRLVSCSRGASTSAQPRATGLAAAEAALIELPTADLPLVETNPAAYAEAHFHGPLCHVCTPSQPLSPRRSRPSSPESGLSRPRHATLFAACRASRTAPRRRRSRSGPPAKPILPLTRVSRGGSRAATATHARPRARWVRTMSPRGRRGVTSCRRIWPPACLAR